VADDPELQEMVPQLLGFGPVVTQLFPSCTQLLGQQICAITSGVAAHTKAMVNA
jgi:hypothetical protein